MKGFCERFVENRPVFIFYFRLGFMAPDKPLPDSVPGLVDPGFEIRDPEKTFSGDRIRIQGSKKHRIRVSNTCCQYGADSKVRKFCP